MAPVRPFETIAPADRALRVAGYSGTRLTWSQLDDEPEANAADLRALLRP